MQANWSPAWRMLVAMAGAGLVLQGARQRGFVGTGLALAGLAAGARAVTNTEMKRLIGLGAGRRAVDIHKTINIDAPVDQVFDFWSDVETFPLFMAHVREAQDLGNGLSHWTVAGPLGTSFSFDAVITKLEPSRTIAWKSVPGALVAHAGILHFEPTVGGGTRLGIQMSYNPPLGVLGHAVASLLGADPKSALNEDLVRLKSLIEHGKTTVHGETVTREEVTRRIALHRARREAA
jgi:uncharacterized membrane protein